MTKNKIKVAKFKDNEQLKIDLCKFADCLDNCKDYEMGFNFVSCLDSNSMLKLSRYLYEDYGGDLND